MKNRTVFALLCFISLLLFSSCSKDSEMPIDDNKSQETLRLRDLYATKVQGSWSHVYEKELVCVEQSYTFDEDGTFKGHLLVKTREWVTVKGESVLTDWETLIDDDITGVWDLRYLSSEKRNVMTLAAQSGYAPSSPLDFIGADDDFLEIKSPYIINEIIKMKRADA